MLCFVFNSLRKYVFVRFVNISGNVEEEFENTKGRQSESVYRRKTDYTMTERKSTKAQEEFEDTKGVIRIRKSKKNRQNNDQKDKQRSTKHTHTTNTNYTKNRG